VCVCSCLRPRRGQNGFTSRCAGARWEIDTDSRAGDERTHTHTLIMQRGWRDEYLTVIWTEQMDVREEREGSTSRPSRQMTSLT